MTLSVLMYAMMITTFVALVGVLVVDAVRDVLRSSARRAPRSAGQPGSAGPRRTAARAHAARPDLTPET
jgi:hypothetical protein